MAATIEKQDRVMATAKQIVKSLKTSKDATQDMILIFSSFDNRLLNITSLMSNADGGGRDRGESEASSLFGNEVNVPSSGSRDHGLVHISGVKGRKVVVELPLEGNKIGAHKGSSENARKAFDEMPKSVSGEDKVTLGDPEGSEG
ncbi:hypothetical protein U1Q18_000459 [Sarracenia purpurea var. burkii]